MFENLLQAGQSWFSAALYLVLLSTWGVVHALEKAIHIFVTNILYLIPSQHLFAHLECEVSGMSGASGGRPTTTTV